MRLSERLRKLVERAFAAWVRRIGDEWLDRVIGSPPVMRFMFAEMARRFEPDKGEGFAGDIVYELRRTDGRVVAWTVTVAGARATARPGRAAEPQLRVLLGVADFARLAAQQLEPGAALLAGRLDVHGDFAQAARLGAMFGQPGPF
ncbi:MAG TPA: SCP2 sterol-binding domain-containing protein [Solirubrobacteraceae bacterium]